MINVTDLLTTQVFSATLLNRTDLLLSADNVIDNSANVNADVLFSRRPIVLLHMCKEYLTVVNWDEIQNKYHVLK